MIPATSKNQSNTVVQFIRGVWIKLTQKPDVYPIRYYKKAKRLGRDRSMMLV